MIIIYKAIQESGPILITVGNNKNAFLTEGNFQCAVAELGFYAISNNYIVEINEKSIPT